MRAILLGFDHYAALANEMTSVKYSHKLSKSSSYEKFSSVEMSELGQLSEIFCTKSWISPTIFLHLSHPFFIYMALQLLRLSVMLNSFSLDFLRKFYTWSFESHASLSSSLQPDCTCYWDSWEWCFCALSFLMTYELMEFLLVYFSFVLLYWHPLWSNSFAHAFQHWFFLTGSMVTYSLCLMRMTIPTLKATVM